jgi:hypothetical protein
MAAVSYIIIITISRQKTRILHAGRESPGNGGDLAIVTVDFMDLNSYTD